MNTQGARDLVVHSVTGVDLALPVAGPGARCYAFVIDWLIRAILFAAWYGAAALIYNGRWSLGAPLSPDAKWFAFVVAPAAGTYFLYHIVLEIALQGRTPGKRIAGIHIVARDGSPPSLGSLLTRNVFRLVDSLPVFYGVGLVATLVTKDHLRIGDMAAGTLLAYEHADLALPEQHGPIRGSLLTTADAEIANDLLLRWSSLDPAARRRLATAIIARYRPVRSTTLQPVPPASPLHPVAPATPLDIETSDAALRTQLETLIEGRRG
jgi:uncharacterized RDD family membrane protein YckC